MSAYSALVCKISNLRPIQGADRIQLATVAGYNIIVGKDVKDGQLGVFFGQEGQLDEEHLLVNKLYKKDPGTGEEMGGLFSANGRIRAIKLKGQISEGFWQPIEAFAWTGVNINKLKDGDTFTELNGKEICRKYYSPAAVKAMNRQKNKGQSALRFKLSEKYDTFKQHFETAQLRSNIKNIPKNSIIWISCKCHGTSARTGNVLSKPVGPITKAVEQVADLMGHSITLKLMGKIPREQRITTRNVIMRGLQVVHDYVADNELDFAAKYLKINPARKFEYVSGTRRTIIDPNLDAEIGYYSGKKFRLQIHKHLKSLNLPKGITLFLEIVGFADDSSQIMPSHKIEDKEIKKQYGNTMTYAYGCNKDNPLECYKTLVYRITMTNDDGYAVELPWVSVVEFCERYGLQTVPLLAGPIVYDGDKTKLLELCRELSDGPDVLDSTHTREGVCVRVEHKDLTTIYKWKSIIFSLLENINHSDVFIDPEDMA